MFTLKSMSTFSLFVMFTITLNIFDTILVSGQFRGQLTDISAPDCIQSNGRRGKCYRQEECGQFYRNKVSFDVCELSTQYLTVCCDELPSSRYNVFRADNSWLGDGPFATDFECGIRIANRDILDVINAPGDPNDQGQLLIQALTYLAARDGTHPWMAALWYKNRPICGATIINRRSALTSAHCFTFSR
ncbi:uncharacterized protein LOC107364440 [Tetranychus urticae]|uniref:uncharacterized protein LOC107364440 n=1 Tax=Tetranychus urticae TaxID=32264 RepID=UPI000D6427F5|nr:uncharacterized protein LOC107364440 [Tetranychus urticae]